MNSVYNRANAIFGYAVTVLFVVTALNAFTGYFMMQEPNVSIKLHNVDHL